jgi:hypothetical protein
MARKDSKRQARFVADGRRRVVAGELPRIRREVEARYAPRLAEAGFLQRLRLRITIHREIQRELERIAPKDGLYAKH